MTIGDYQNSDLQDQQNLRVQYARERIPTLGEINGMMPAAIKDYEIEGFAKPLADYGAHELGSMANRIMAELDRRDEDAEETKRVTAATRELLAGRKPKPAKRRERVRVTKVLVDSKGVSL